MPRKGRVTKLAETTNIMEYSDTYYNYPIEVGPGFPADYLEIEDDIIWMSLDRYDEYLNSIGREQTELDQKVQQYRLDKDVKVC